MTNSRARGGNSILHTAAHAQISDTGSNYVAIGSNMTQSSSTETLMNTPIDFQFTLKSLKAIVRANSRSGTTTLLFRDDAATIATITIATTATGEFEDLVTAQVASGSACCFAIINTAAGTGTIDITTIFAEIKS